MYSSLQSILVLATALTIMTPGAQSQTTYADDACSRCTYGTITQEPTCAALVPVDMQQLQGAFANHTVNIGALAIAIKNPAIKNCVCHWGTDTFTAKGAAAACLTGGATPACNATQAEQGSTGLAPMVKMMGCPAAGASPTPTTGAQVPPQGPGSAPVGAGGASGGTTVQIKGAWMGVMAVLSAAAFGSLV